MLHRVILIIHILSSWDSTRNVQSMMRTHAKREHKITDYHFFVFGCNMSLCKIFHGKVCRHHLLTACNYSARVVVKCYAQLIQTVYVNYVDYVVCMSALYLLFHILVLLRMLLESSIYRKGVNIRNET